MKIQIFSPQSIFSPPRLIKLGATDLRNIVRDPTLLAVLIFSILPVLIFHFFKIQINQATLSTFGISNISTFAAPVFLLMPSYLIGWIIGFLILEERDEGPLLALQVTPIGKRGIALYRALLTFTLAFALSLFATPILFEKISLPSAIFLSSLSAIEAVTVTFALPAIAKNKVQGLAFTKVMNIFIMVPLLAIIASPWRYLAGIFPSFWVGEYLSLSQQDHLPFAIIIALTMLSHIGVAALFYKALLANRE